VSFSLNIKVLRQEKKMSQADLASILGVTTKSISNYEQGLSQPHLGQLITIAKLFNVSTDHLLGFSPKKTYPNQETFDNLPIVGDLATPISNRPSAAYVPTDPKSYLTTYIDTPANAGYSLPSDYQNTGRRLYIPGLQHHNTIMLPVKGDSMYPDISDSDHVICQLLTTPPHKYYNKLTVVIDTDGAVLIKRLSTDPATATYTLHSTNPAYFPITLPHTDVKQLWAVTHILKQI
jgi:transcriptional regulator with XRE-family HTH domain